MKQQHRNKKREFLEISIIYAVVVTTVLLGFLLNVVMSDVHLSTGKNYVEQPYSQYPGKVAR